jgi:taurine dioxygenase
MRRNAPAFTPTSGGVGAFVSGIDLAKDLPGEVIGTLVQALGEHGVLFFRDQAITPEQHLAFARRFAPVVPNKFLDQVPGHPEIALLNKKPGQRYNIGGDWHADHSYEAAPAIGSVLVARQVPPRGGDTCFANMYRAYTELSDGLKATLESLATVHCTSHVFGPGARTPRLYAPEEDGRGIKPEDFVIQEAIHPMVIRHPISGLSVVRTFGTI